MLIKCAEKILEASSPVYIWEKYCSLASHNSAAALSSMIRFRVVYDKACIA
jgi:hypothetical protein